MTARERLDVLRGVAELSRVDEATLRSLPPFFDEVYVPAGTVVAQDGRLGHEFFVVSAGELDVCRGGRRSRLGRGEAFGWKAMRDRGPHDATVVTMSPAHLLVMSHAQFRSVEGVAAGS